MIRTQPDKKGILCPVDSSRFTRLVDVYFSMFLISDLTPVFPSIFWQFWFQVDEVLKGFLVSHL